MRARVQRGAPLLAFALACYLPLLVTSPGQVVADTKSYLYLDPSRLLSRAWSMWDPHVGLGTVTHQNIGFLWPMGPYYWLMEHLGSPDWVAQRLWLGSIMLVAGLGVRFLLRTVAWRGPAVAAAMCAYAFTPYLLTIAVRISAILLPYVALPWMLALTVRALRTGSWRHPAIFALVVATVGTSNATSIALAGVGPLLWLLWCAITRAQPLARIATVVGRIGVLCLAANAWWIAGLSVQATNGIDVLRYTESVETTAAASSAQEILRGLGYWFFYGDDARGPWVGPSRPFQASVWLLAVTFAVPILALASGALARWRQRSFFVLLLVVGLVLAVGVYPYDAPSPFGRGLKAFLNSDVGMAMRSMPRAAPLVVLALAVMLGAAVHAVGLRWPRLAVGSAGLVIALVVLGMPPLWQRTLAPENLRRPEAIPAYWHEAGAYLDATDDGTRVLELPGSDFTSYRWGTTLDPVTPGLTDRPMVARELQPMGSPAAWNLLKAFDGRLQARLFEPAAIAPVARTMRAGQILLRSDLEYEHYDTPRPRDLWQLVRSAPGIGTATTFGPPAPNVAQPPAPMIDELELSLDPNLPHPPPVDVLPVEGVLPIVVTQSGAAPVVMAGDGEGVVDAAAAGLIDGTELLRYSASMSDRELSAALRDGAVLVLTDSNRRRGERWGTVRFTTGYTEPAGLRPLVVDRSDARLPVFPGAGDDARTVAVHSGGITANATSYGGRNEYLPEDRPANALDGDPTTSWRTSRDDPVQGERLVVRTERPVAARALTFLAPPPPINRWVTRVALRFDGGAPVVAELDERSRSGAGQVVDIGERTFSTLDIEILADSAGPQGRYGGLTSTGFAEVAVGDLRLDELVRPPVDLLGRAGAASRDHALAIVLTRLRSAPTDVERLDEERSLARLVGLPTARQLTLGGAARLAPRADDALIDTMLAGGPGNTSAALTATSSSRLGGVRARASAAVDGDHRTAWVAAYGEQAGQWIELRSDAPRALDRLELAVVADGRHSVPTRVRIVADGRDVATLAVPSVPDGSSPGATTTVSLRLPAVVSASSVRLVVEEVRALETTDWGTRKIRTLPVGIAELGLAGWERPAPGGSLDTGCRDDLLTVDDRPLGVRITGTVADALAGAALSVTTCDDQAVELSAGDHVLRATQGATTGFDLDRLVLRSAAGGGPDAGTSTLRATAWPATADAPRSTVVGERPDALTVRIDGARPGEPFWLAFGQGFNTGWQATIAGADLGAPVLVDGFANGWLVDPDQTAFEISLRFTPQRRVTVALWASLVAALVCLVLALRRPRHADPVAGRAGAPDGPGVPEGLTATSVAGAPSTPLPLPAALAVTALLGGLGVAVATPVVGVVVAALAMATASGRIPRLATVAVAPVAMAASAGYVVLTVWRHRTLPGLEWPAELHRAHPIAWLAVLALAVDPVVVALRARRRR